MDSVIANHKSFGWISNSKGIYIRTQNEINLDKTKLSNIIKDCMPECVPYKNNNQRWSENENRGNTNLKNLILYKGKIIYILSLKADNRRDYGYPINPFVTELCNESNFCMVLARDESDGGEIKGRFMVLDNEETNEIINSVNNYNNNYNFRNLFEKGIGVIEFKGEKNLQELLEKSLCRIG